MTDLQSSPIYPQFEKMLPRKTRQQRLGQKSHAFWLYGLSGSGKSTLAIALEQKLFEAGYFCQVLDGDNVRTGLNQDLGFSVEDRTENIRRISEVAKLFVQSGVIVITSFITPLNALRQEARSIVGDADFSDIYVKASFEKCAARDPKGLYAKVKAGEVKQFTGKDSGFEEPANPDLLIDTEKQSVEESVELLFSKVLKTIKLS